MSDIFRPCDLGPTRLLCPWNSPGKNIGVDCCFLVSPGDIRNSGIAPGFPALQVNSLPFESPGEPYETIPIQKNIYFCFFDYAKALDYVDHIKLWKILKDMGTPDP